MRGRRSSSRVYTRSEAEPTDQAHQPLGPRHYSVNGVGNLGEIGVIILAGGRSTRMGADKATVRVNGTRLVDKILTSLPAGMPRVVVTSADLGFDTVSEEPPFGGPVAGIAAGLENLYSPFVAVVPVDTPYLPVLLPVLRHEIQAADVAVVESLDGNVQALCALWRRSSLKQVLADLGTDNVDAKELLCAAHQVVIIRGDGSERDYNTVEDLETLGHVEL